MERSLRIVNKIKVRRHVGQYFGALRDAETQPRLGSADNIGSLTDGPVDAVLRLQAPIRNNPARIGDVGAVSGNFRGAGGTAVSCKSPRGACDQRGRKQDARDRKTATFG